MKYLSNMKNVCFSLIIYMLISCSHINENKVNYDFNTKKSLIEFEDIYTNQQHSGVELGPWWIFYKIKIHNITDSTISLYPNKEFVSVKDIESIRNIKKEELKRDELLKKIFFPSDVGDSFLLFKNDTIPLLCSYSPIILPQDSCNKYVFYTNSVETKQLYDLYIQEYKEFQCFLSDIVKKSVFVVIFNKKDTCYFSPSIELKFYGDPNEQSEWSF